VKCQFIGNEDSFFRRLTINFAWKMINIFICRSLHVFIVIQNLPNFGVKINSIQWKVVRYSFSCYKCWGRGYKKVECMRSMTFPYCASWWQSSVICTGRTRKRNYVDIAALRKTSQARPRRIGPSKETRRTYTQYVLLAECWGKRHGECDVVGRYLEPTLVFNNIYKILLFSCIILAVIKRHKSVWCVMPTAI
jgi:hypothetical protein